MFYKNWKFLTKKETNRLKHRGGPTSVKTSKERMRRMQSNEEVLKRTLT